MKKTFRNLAIMTVIATMTIGSTSVFAKTSTAVSATSNTATEFTDSIEVNNSNVEIGSENGIVLEGTYLADSKAYNEDLAKYLQLGILTSNLGLDFKIVTPKEVIGYSDTKLASEMKNGKTILIVLKDKGFTNSFVEQSTNNFNSLTNELSNRGYIASSDLSDLQKDYKKSLDNIDDSIVAKQAAFVVGQEIGTKTSLVKFLNSDTDSLVYKLNDGKYIYNLLDDAGKLNDYKTSLLACADKELSQMVSDNELKQSQADAVYRTLERQVVALNLASFSNYSNIDILTLVHEVYNF